MKTQHECIPCIINSYLRLAETKFIPEPQQEVILRRLLADLAGMDFALSPPVMGRRIQELLRESLQDPDPYRQIKHDYNHMMLDLYPSLKEKVEDSEDPFDTAIRLAVAGNVIDFGAKYHYNLMERLGKIMEHQLAVDDSKELRHDLEEAKTLLYIGDNCGEIVLDKLFLESIKVPHKIFVVRKSPVINDVIREDAEMTGMDQIAQVITTGDNSPGAVWESASDTFK